MFNNNTKLNINNFKCKHCLRKIETPKIFYLINDLHQKHLVYLCICRKGLIYIPLVDNLHIETRKSAKLLKKEARKNQSSLFTS